MRPAKATEGCKIAADQDLAFSHAVCWIRHNGKYRAICADSRVPRTIDAGIVIEPRDKWSGHPFDRQKRSTREQSTSAVLSESFRQCKHSVICSRARIEKTVQ